tara:strand:+ start:908 stop:1084 length:177 start_codon:yes stop_codon:yes gene_type:complete
MEKKKVVKAVKAAVKKVDKKDLVMEWVKASIEHKRITDSVQKAVARKKLEEIEAQILS